MGGIKEKLDITFVYIERLQMQLEIDSSLLLKVFVYTSTLWIEYSSFKFVTFWYRDNQKRKGNAYLMKEHSF